ncbi:gluconate 2-dehydrogenase subunit 3 family protein [Georgenia halophila]|uniref:Gluconate 2-dehydrogenase subunit 3 family protein n=1 Tax=Georgenia halophila TaxID=620889 RepID=A0ABP8LLI3_9MICO
MNESRKDETPESSGFSRRAFLGSGPVLGSLALVACSPRPSAQEAAPVPPEGDTQAPAREPVPPNQVPRLGVNEFFTEAEAETVGAVVARLIPGDEEIPSAREAGVVNYIDQKLADFARFAEPTYLQKPFAAGYESSPDEVADDLVAVPKDQLYRYGWQSGTLPQETYRNGLPALDDYCRQRFSAAFLDLDEGQQDTVLLVMDHVQRRSSGGRDNVSSNAPTDAELDEAEQAFGDVDPGGLFATVYGDTIEGMFADPVYGGNRGLAGWNLIDYPGPQRSYSPEEMKNGTDREPQSLHGLPPMSPARQQPHAIAPMQQSNSGPR